MVRKLTVRWEATVLYNLSERQRFQAHGGPTGLRASSIHELLEGFGLVRRSCCTKNCGRGSSIACRLFFFFVQVGQR